MNITVIGVKRDNSHATYVTGDELAIGCWFRDNTGYIQVLHDQPTWSTAVMLAGDNVIEVEVKIFLKG